MCLVNHITNLAREHKSGYHRGCEKLKSNASEYTDGHIGEWRLIEMNMLKCICIGTGYIHEYLYGTEWDFI